jgi:signal transduction histidine kinase
LQEAVNNSLKHSKGKNINITFSAANDWTAEVEDDGAGITKRVSSSYGGNGLQNMKDRCGEAGWEISWEQKQGRGTTVKITSAAN